jgi:dolichyl-phosphate-mannose--protein O-mannosyl transferase
MWVKKNLEIVKDLLSLGIFLWILDLSQARGIQHVTCGSVLKLMNTAYKVRLHSHDIKYGSGSGQQSVTGSELKEDVNSLWVVKGVPKLPCKRGEPVHCGSKLRLEHLQTGRNLHSHLFSSPLSGSQEISAFGENGEGDTGDYWEVQCDGESWERDDPVQFRHLDTDTYLSASGNTYGRPIHGQMEIIGSTHRDSTSYWKAMEGVFVHPSEGPTKSHSENEHTEL